LLVKTTNWLVLALTGAALVGLASACGSTDETPEATGGNAGSGAGVSGATAGGSSGASGSGAGTSGAGAMSGASGAGGGAGGAGNAGAGGTGGAGAAGVGGGAGIGGAGAAGAAGSAGAGGAAGDAGSAGTAGSAGMMPVERPGVVTSGAGEYWQVGTLTEASGAAAVTVNATQTFQDWIGFGGTFNEAGWDALSELGAADRDRAIRLLFSPSEGANFKWGRIPIGASDYAMDRYTLNETAGDYTMTSFSIERDRQRLIPYVRAAQAVKPDIRFWASPWTPPTWMKDPPEFDGTDAGPNGQPAATYEAFMKDDEQTLEAYALYLARWVEEWELEGIPIDSVHPQNEPGYSTRYPSCRWEAGLLGRFVGDFLGPTFDARGLETDIWFGTLSNNESAVYSGNIGGLTGAAEEYTVGVGLQWNTMEHTGELAQRGFLVMQTEHRCGNYPFTVQGAPPFNPDMPQNDHAYAVESWGYLRDWIEEGVNSYSAWNMVLDTVGKNLDAQRPWPQNALLVVDRETDMLVETPAYYVFRHLSYFVDPGAVRVGVSGGDALAFQNPDGSLVAVLHNSASQPADTTVAMGDKTYQVAIPAQGFATLFHTQG
jgi:glucosylceramidase